MYGGYVSGSIPIVLTISPIAEPEIYALMLVGLGFMGLMGRRKKQKTVS